MGEYFRPVILGGAEKFQTPFQGAKIFEQPDYKARIVKRGLGEIFSHAILGGGGKDSE